MSRIEIKAVPRGLATIITGSIDGVVVCKAANGEGEWYFWIEQDVRHLQKFSTMEAFATCVERVMSRAKEYGAE